MTFSISDVDVGDYAKIDGQWEEIVNIDRHYRFGQLRWWEVTTMSGKYSMFDIERYAPAGNPS